ncbi:MAG: dipeptide epimerase [Rhodomicrobium sp.]|nr:MAG: dipeptide epimerase [Rhodomicrobium sp.]
MSRYRLSVTRQKWPINGSFRISRGSKRYAEVVYVEITYGDFKGCGEAVPYARYGETTKSVIHQIKDISPAIEQGLTRLELVKTMPPGAARNAIDAALWDLEAKSLNQPAALLANIEQVPPVLTCYTISLNTAEKMAEAALQAQYHPLLKLKLGAGLKEDRAAMLAVRRALPQHRLVIDANEGWTEDTLFPLMDTAYECGIELIEQPLPVSRDEILRDLDPMLPICADESFHTIDDLEEIAEKYQAINIKTDKTGGLTHALAVHIAARNLGLKIMVGCMVGTSLAMAPAFLLSADADWVDLDGPLLLQKDRPFGLSAHNGILTPPERELWG